MKTALITGITGQDGYFLSKLLIEKGYEVHGLVRRNSQMSFGSLRKLDEATFKQIKIHWGDVTDHTVIVKLVHEMQFDEIYHLAAQSFVALSFTNPQVTYDTNISGTLNVVNAIKEFSPKTRLYFAATSELYGKAQAKPQNEATPFYPRSPYGVSKLAGFWTVKNYREAYGLFMCSGILFNHESEMRGEEFVTKKIVKAVVDISRGKKEFLEIGNLYARRDWGYAGDYVDGMWLMLQQPEPDDFVLATGVNHSIKDFIQVAFKNLGIDLVWEGEGLEEVGKNMADGKILVKVNRDFFRPSDVEDLVGDASRAKSVLGWSFTVDFEKIVKIMIDYELAQI